MRVVSLAMRSTAPPGGYRLDARTVDGLLLERHTYGPGPAGGTPPHAHAEHQLCLSFDFPGEYRWRDGAEPVPPGSISIVPAGEVHSARDPQDRPVSTTFLVLYLPPERLAGTAEDIDGGSRSPVPLRRAIFADRGLARSLLAFASVPDRPQLARDELCLDLLSAVLRRSASRPEPPLAGRETRAVRLAKAWIEADPAADVTLDALAGITGLSPFRLARAFRADVGMPPHAYQVALRVSIAQRLLAGGSSPARAAIDAGFYDQSHLGRHFVRVVGTTPARYAAGARSS